MSLSAAPIAARISPATAAGEPSIFPTTIPSDTDVSKLPPKFVAEWVDGLLRAAIDAQASDIHLTPSETALAISFRVDGVLSQRATLPRGLTPNVIARMKVLAELLTYHTELPQEGRLRWPAADVEMRFSTFPTVYGERGVVRLFIGAARFRTLGDLGLPADLQSELPRLFLETSGVILLTGPAGSGKTTTAYAALRELQRELGHGKCLITVEDPVEAILPGVTQSQVNRAAGFDYVVGLRSLMRQDPDVILVGEIRDRETAETVFQAGLTGHLVFSTFHAGNSAEAVSRLSEMGIEPYVLKSGLLGIVCQRLIRRVCECGVWTEEPEQLLGLPVSRVRQPTGCRVCGSSGYAGRMLLAELMTLHPPALGAAVLARADAAEIRRIAIESGLTSLGQRALSAMESGQTTAAEIRRVFGFRPLEAV